MKESLIVTQLERDGARSELVRLMEVEQELETRATEFDAEIQRAAEDAQQALDSLREAEQERTRLTEERELLAAELAQIHERPQVTEREREAAVEAAADQPFLTARRGGRVPESIGSRGVRP